MRRLVLDLLDAGMAEHVLLSQDVGQIPELRSSGGRGYTYLAETFLPALGLDAAARRTLTIDNPRRWLTVSE